MKRLKSLNSVDCFFKKYTLLTSKACKEYSLLDRDSRIAREYTNGCKAYISLPGAHATARARSTAGGQVKSNLQR